MANRSLVVQQKTTDCSRWQFNNKYLDPTELQKPSQEVALATKKHTEQQLRSLVSSKTMVSQQHVGSDVRSSIQQHQGSQYIQYQPKNSNNSRMIKMQQTQVDPLNPPEHKHKRIPQQPVRSPPPVILHSPTRQITASEKQEWKIPPCVSNWKNVNGWTIALEMRVNADGRRLLEGNKTVNGRFAELADAFSVAERHAREEIEERQRVGKSVKYQEFLREEERLRQEAVKAREEQKDINNNRNYKEESNDNNNNKNDDQGDERMQREQLRYLRTRELERELRMNRMGKQKSKAVRDSERDISEKVALGQAQATSSELLVDARLYNFDHGGVGDGFVEDDEDQLYDKPLFADRTEANIYKNVKAPIDDDEPEEEENEEYSKRKVVRKVPKRGFEGADYQNSLKARPVQFEKHEDEIFGMGAFVDNVKKQVKKN